APTFTRADDVHGAHILENLGGSEDLADLGLRGILETKLADIALRLTIRLGRQNHARRGPRPAAIRFQLCRHVTTLRPSRLAARLVEEAQLRCGIAVARLGAKSVYR